MSVDINIESYLTVRCLEAFKIFQKLLSCFYRFLYSTFEMLKDYPSIYSNSYQDICVVFNSLRRRYFPSFHSHFGEMFSVCQSPHHWQYLSSGYRGPVRHSLAHLKMASILTIFSLFEYFLNTYQTKPFKNSSFAYLQLEFRFVK